MIQGIIPLPHTEDDIDKFGIKKRSNVQFNNKKSKLFLCWGMQTVFSCWVIQTIGNVKSMMCYYSSGRGWESQSESNESME